MPASDDATREQALSVLSHSPARTARINVQCPVPPHAGNNGHSSQTGCCWNSIVPSMTPAALTRAVHDFLSDLLRHLRPEIGRECVGMDQRWREGVRVVFGNAPKDHSLPLAR